MTLLQLNGRRFGSLLVMGRASSDGRHVRWACVCDCGRECTVIASNLTRGHTGTCGGSAHRRSMTPTKKDHPLYQVWKEMRRRCVDPRSTSYKHYGARGVTVCAEWAEFWTFVADMGARPTPEHQLDRHKSTDNYSKATCRWVTAGENSRNRDFVKLTDDTARLAKQRIAAGAVRRDIAREFGVSPDCIRDIEIGRTWKHVAVYPAPDGVIQQGA